MHSRISHSVQGFLLSFRVAGKELNIGGHVNLRGRKFHCCLIIWIMKTQITWICELRWDEIPAMNQIFKVCYEKYAHLNRNQITLTPPPTFSTSTTYHPPSQFFTKLCFNNCDLNLQINMLCSICYDCLSGYTRITYLGVESLFVCYWYYHFGNCRP